MKSFSFLCVLIFIALGCSTTPQTTVVPRESGDYFIISSSRDENKALESAVSEGNKYCQTQGKSFVVAEPRDELKETNKSLGKASDVADAVLGKILGDKEKVKQMKNKAYTRDGNQLVMNFKCK